MQHLDPWKELKCLPALASKFCSKLHKVFLWAACSTSYLQSFQSWNERKKLEKQHVSTKVRPVNQHCSIHRESIFKPLELNSLCCQILTLKYTIISDMWTDKLKKNSSIPQHSSINRHHQYAGMCSWINCQLMLPIGICNPQMIFPMDHCLYKTTWRRFFCPTNSRFSFTKSIQACLDCEQSDLVWIARTSRGRQLRNNLQQKEIEENKKLKFSC